MAASSRFAGTAAEPPLVKAHSCIPGDRIAHLVTLLFAVSIIVLTALVLYELVSASELSRAKFGWSFAFTQIWNPVTGEFGALPFIYGTVVTSVLALIIAGPLGLGCAIFLSELAPPHLSSALTFVVELLAAVPSVIYGLLALFALVPLLRNPIEPWLKAWFGFLPWFQGPAYGVGYLAAGLVLAIMIVPFIASVSRESLLAVPREQREAALALGATRWEAIWNVALPCARSGIAGSVFLALARALAETMAVTMVIGNDPKIRESLFAPGYTIAAVIANEFTEAITNLHLSALIELGLVLFVITAVMNGLGQLFMLATSRTGSIHA
ncbi:MAG: phosphate ABC transporter permease subunit PstC [Terriglobia bacterium]